jgi:hypothetical protein
VETVISVLIMGLAVVTIAAAMGASARNSELITDRAAAENEARRLADYLRSSAVALEPCQAESEEPDAEVPYQAAVDAVVTAGFDARVIEVAYWSGMGEYNDDATCAGGPTFAQRITVQAKREGADSGAAVTVVKREE